MLCGNGEQTPLSSALDLHASEHQLLRAGRICFGLRADDVLVGAAKSVFHFEQRGLLESKSGNLRGALRFPELGPFWRFCRVI